MSDAGTRTTSPGKTRSRQLLEIIVVGVIYYAAARLGLLLQLPGTNASPVWPPSGIGLAGMLLCGIRVWPGIAAAAFFANLLTLPFTSAGLLAAAAIAAGNTVEHLAAVSLIRRVSPALNPFECARDALWFVAAALASCLIAATNGATVLWVSGIIGPQLYRSAWLTWWIGDFVGMVILGPALYAWGRRPRIDWPSARMLEAAGLAVTAVLVGELVLGNWTTVPFVASQKYLLIPPLLWAAFRFGQREASSLAVVISTIAVSYTWSVMRLPSSVLTTLPDVALGPFVDLTTTPNDWLLSLQLFICTNAVVAIVLASAVEERDRSERALLESENRFRTIFEQAAVGVALIDTRTGRFQRVNQRYCDIVGRTMDEMTRTTFQAITHPDDLQEDLDYMTRLTAGDISQFSMEKRYYRKDGSTVWVNLTASPTWKPDERPEYHIAIVEDITTRKQAEQRFRASVESAPTAMVMTDCHGEIVLVNQEAERMLGYDRSELIGRRVEVLLPERFQAVHPAHRAGFSAVPTRRQMGVGRDLYCVRKNGTEFPVEIGLNPIQTEEGTFTLSAIADITLRKRFETTLRDMNLVLEGRVRERTSQLETANRELEQQVCERQRIEAELRQSLEEKDSLIHEKDTLLREIHHRVKNNLAVVSGLFYLETTHLNDERALRVLHQAQHRVRSMAMVHEALYRSGNLGAINFREYLQALLDYLLQSYSVASGRITVETTFDDLTLGPDSAIPCGLIFTELLTNSFKHAFPMGRAGVISASLHANANGCHELAVVDDGVGVSAGASAEKASTLGWRLVQSLAGQLDGTFVIRRAEPGTVAILQFPARVA